MLWLCAYFPTLPTQALQLADRPTGVCERRNTHRYVMHTNLQAERLGVRAGMPVGAATALAPALLLVDRNPAAEHNLLKQLCNTAFSVSPEIIPDYTRGLLWCEISGSLHYFGGLEALLDQAREAFAATGINTLLSVGPTLESAVLLAAGNQLPVIERAKLRSRLAMCPVSALPLPESTTAGLSQAGITQLAQLEALPRDALTRRFGAEPLDYLDRLMGRAPDVRSRYQPPPTYSRRLEFADAVENTEALLFASKRMLGEFAEYLKARDRAVQNFDLLFQHEARTLSRVPIGLSSPTRDTAHLLTVLREKIDRLRLAEPVTSMTLLAEQFSNLENPQTSLLADGKREAAWRAVLDRLRARLGQDAVRQLGLADTHLPELTNRIVVKPEAVSASARPKRPLWLLRQPRRLPEKPSLVSLAERIETQWWSGADVQRDYHSAALPDGSQVWVYRDLRDGRWYLHGLWS